MLDTDVLILQRLFFVLGAGKKRGRSLSQMKLSRRRSRPADLWNFCETLFGPGFGGGAGYPGLFQDRTGEAVGLIQQCRQQVLDVDALVTPVHGEGRCGLQRLLYFQRHTVHIHDCDSPFSRSQVNLMSSPDNHVHGKIKPSGTTIVVPG